MRTTENVTHGGWVWLLNQCRDAGISRIDLLVKQDEDNFKSLRTESTLQSGELLVALPDEKTAEGWENSDWLKEMLARAKEMRIEVWAWWPCFHDAQMAKMFPGAAYSSQRNETFVDAASPEAQQRQEELLLKLVETYPFDGVSLDWVRWNSWEDGSKGPLGDLFARRWDFDWDEPNALDTDYLRARWYEARADALVTWVSRVVSSARTEHPRVRWGAFLLPPGFTAASQSYPKLATSGLDYLQPMGYWNDWKQPPEWVGTNVLGRHRSLSSGTAYWPALGIDSPDEEIARALRSIPPDPVSGLAWFTYGAWEQKTFDKLRVVLSANAQAQVLTGLPPAPTPAPPATALPGRKRAQPKAFHEDTTVWSVVCLAELYKRGALAVKSDDPVCPILAFHTFADAEAGSPQFLYKCSTAYLDALLKALADAGFNVCPLTRWQTYLITGDPAVLPPKPLVITIDDGSESVYKLFAPRAARYKYPYSLAVVTSWLGDGPTSDHATMELGKPDPTMTWKQAKELFDTGFVEIIAHSDSLHYQAVEQVGAEQATPAETTRQFLLERGRTETMLEYERRIRNDMLTTRRRLSEHDFDATTIFCWPYGEWNQQAKLIARKAGFTHFLLFETSAAFSSRENALDDDLPRIPIVRHDERFPLSFPSERDEAQSWWLAFLRTARLSANRPLLAATLAQLAPENADHPLAELSRATMDFLRGDAGAGLHRIMRLRQRYPFDPAIQVAIDQTLNQYSPRPK